jgi:formate-dependent nitrite reductase cytochrome c552 subunit
MTCHERCLEIRTSMRRLLLAAGLFALSVVLTTDADAQGAVTPSYVGSETCADCHNEATSDWQGSDHALAWTLPGAKAVLGDFNNAAFEHRGVTSRFMRDGNTFVIETDGPDGTMTQYPVAGVAGIEPLQQYLLETEPGKLQSFDVAWDTELERWYHLYPDQNLPAGNGLHWTGPYKNWNARCAECHATNFEKNFMQSSNSYQSTQAEIGVGCEACHGPGQAHLDWTVTGNLFNSSNWADVDVKGFVVDMLQGGETEVQQCAGCHSRREPFMAGNPLPGTPFHDAYRLSTLRDGLYHSDG